MRILSTTAASAYRLDVDQLAKEVLHQQESTYKQTARFPCAVHLHPTTRREVMKYKPESAALRYWQPTVDGVKPDTFVGLAIVIDDSVPLGYATLEVCEGCLALGGPAHCLHDRS